MMLVILLIVISTGSAHNCSITTKSNIKVADCSKRNWTEIPIDLPANIEVLDLSDNKLISIKANNSLTSYSRLKTLILNNNEINHVHSEGFKGMENLQTLILAKNRLNISQEDGKSILRNIKYISKFDVGSQHFAEYNKSYVFGYIRYPDDLFQMLTNLEDLSIDLYGNPDFGVGFRNMTLRSLRFDKCYVRILQNKTFTNFPISVTKMHLRECKFLTNIEIMPTGIFRPFPNLTSIDLSGTTITVSKGLAMLYVFRNNRMDQINFGHMKNEAPNIDRTLLPTSVVLTREMARHLNTICVKTLILSDNNIVDILKSTFYPSAMLPCLEFLDLSGNRFGFVALRSDILLMSLKLSNLKVLDCSYFFFEFQNAKYLEYPLTHKIMPTDDIHTKKEDIEYCSKLKVPTMGVYFPKNIKYLRYTHVIGTPNLRSIILYHTSSLTHIDISYYKGKCLPDITFANNTENNLEFLDASGIESWHYYNKTSIPLFNKLTTLVLKHAELYQAINDNKNPLIYASNLEYLDLSWNGLSVIPRHYLTHLKHLNKLILSNNHLRLTPDDICDLHNLTLLDMIDNKLFTIHLNITTWFDSQLKSTGLFVLKIKLNDFSCACKEQGFLRWLNSTKIRLDKTKNYKCRLANGLYTETDYALSHFHLLYADCQATSWLRLGIALVSSFFTILLPVTIIYNCRWRITFFCFRKFRKIVESSMKLSYDYDVYISYSYDGYSWVKEVLLKHLETNWKLDVCVEERDFLAGASQYEQIANCMEKSRHLIFVVTSDFMCKPLVSYEIDRAIVAKSNHMLQQIIIIALDIEHIPTEFQSLWRDVSVIEWSFDSDDTMLTAVEKLKTKLLLNL